MSRLQEKLVVGVVLGLIAVGGEVGQAVLAKTPSPPIDCTTRNEQIIREVRSDPDIIRVLATQHEPAEQTCGQALRIARTVLKQPDRN